MASQQIDKMFEAMSFEGEDIDPELMAKVMAKMRDDLCAEFSQQNESTSIPEPPAPSPPPTNVINNDANYGVAPPNPTSSSSASIRICLLRFDGVKETEEFSMDVNLDDTAEKFLELTLLSRNLSSDGMSRMDMGSPDSISPISLVQPMWQTMREVFNRIQTSELTQKLTIHWYPMPPTRTYEEDNNSFVGNYNTEVKANWVRVITLTRRSVFVHFDAQLTTVLSLKRSVEELTGVAVEWQRLMLGNRMIETDTPETTLASEFGIKPAINIFLTHRIEGMEYGRNETALS